MDNECYGVQNEEWNSLLRTEICCPLTNQLETDNSHRDSELVRLQIEDIDLQLLQKDLDEEALAYVQTVNLLFMIEKYFELSCKSVKRINRFDSAS